MKVLLTKSITASLLFTLSFCCLLFVALAGCNADISHPAMLQGGFCAAEQTSGGAAANVDAEQPAVLVHTLKLGLIALVGGLIILSILKLIQIAFKERLIRPIRFVKPRPIKKRIFLAYASSPHGG
jgi:hypothetical protein